MNYFQIVQDAIENEAIDEDKISHAESADNIREEIACLTFEVDRLLGRIRCLDHRLQTVNIFDC